jgi:hypothetical protein
MQAPFPALINYGIAILGPGDHHPIPQSLEEGEVILYYTEEDGAGQGTQAIRLSKRQVASLLHELTAYIYPKLMT